MLVRNNKNSCIKSVELINKYAAVTSRANNFEDSTYSHSRVPPWSGEEYYDKLKEEIKMNHSRKRSETSVRRLDNKKHSGHSGYRHISTRVKTVNLQIEHSTQDHFKYQCSKILPKKLSSKIFSRQMVKPDKYLSSQKVSTQLERSILESNPTIHTRKMSLKRFPLAKTRTQRDRTEITEQNFKKMQEIQQNFFKNDTKKNNIFFFETKNKNKVCARERMIMKIRNLQKSKVDRALTNL